jgi:carbon monoxide dehydrogenase subunit G
MRLENEFTVPAAPELAWALLNDIPRVVPCMPGAELSEVVDENTFKATVKVKLGPIGLTFGADIVRDRVDEAGRVVSMTTKARELKGRGGASATIESTLVPDGSGTRVVIVTELALSGTVAQYGRGIVADVSNQMVKQFAACIAAQLETAPPPSVAALVAEVAVAEASAGLAGAPAAAAAARPPARPAQPVQAVGGLSLAFGALGRALLRTLRLRKETP